MRGPRVLVIRVGGTNCDQETLIALEGSGAEVKLTHFKKLLNGAEKLSDYEGLVIPGGFSFGDFVRAGAIWAKKLAHGLGRELERFVEDGRGVLGICNGFQVLVEAGFLPAVEGRRSEPEAALGVNDSMRYECRWVYLLHRRNKCKLLRGVPEGAVLRMPVAHREGKFVLPAEGGDEALSMMERQGQIVLVYARPDGSPARGEYPYNPNGSVADIAAVCNREGNVLGMMPHPERAYFGWQLPDWTGLDEVPDGGDGRAVFSSFVGYLREVM